MKKLPIKVWTSALLRVTYRGKTVRAKRLKINVSKKSVATGTLWFYEVNRDGNIVTKLRGGEPPEGRRYLSVLKAPVYLATPKVSKGRVTVEVMVQAKNDAYTHRELWALHENLLLQGKRRV